VEYNLGDEDLTVGEMSARLDDGKYHVVRFSRSGENATLQVDDNKIQRKHVAGGFYHSVYVNIHNILK